MLGKEIHRKQSLLEEHISALNKRCEELQKKIDFLYELLESYEGALINLRNNNARIEALEQSSETMAFKIKKMEKTNFLVSNSGASQIVSVPSESSDAAFSSQPAVENKYTAIDYFDFENHFRGNRKLIQKRQTKYVPYFKGGHKVIDIGCGRGEFIQLLKENNIEAVGVDTYDEFVEYCSDLGLKALCDDGNHYLSTVKSADGIFVGQVVEQVCLNREHWKMHIIQGK